MNALKYGVTSVNGYFCEEGGTPSKEVSLLVANINHDSSFKSNLFSLSEYFNQDSFIYKPLNGMAYEIGTNYSHNPGYKVEIERGNIHITINAEFMTKFGNRKTGISFTNFKKIIIMKCPNCGAEVSTEDVRCPECYIHIEKAIKLKGETMDKIGVGAADSE